MKTSTTVLAALGVLSLAACAAQPVERTPDQMVTEAVLRCQSKHADMPLLRSTGDGRTLHNEAVTRDYDKWVNLLRTPEGWSAVERRALRALEPIEKFCTLEIAVRLDPDKARALYAKLEKNDDLGWMIVRDEYLREALEPLKPAPGEPTLKDGDKKAEPRKGAEGN